MGSEPAEPQQLEFDFGEEEKRVRALKLARKVIAEQDKNGDYYIRFLYPRKYWFVRRIYHDHGEDWRYLFLCDEDDAAAIVEAGLAYYWT